MNNKVSFLLELVGSKNQPLVRFWFKSINVKQNTSK
jgi:hypothetical protein